MDFLQVIMPLIDGASYVGIFFLVAASGYILPVPEELFLILVGYLVYAGFFPLIPVSMVALFATFTHDQILYHLGRSENQRAKWFLEKFSQITFIQHDVLVRKHIYRVIFYSRFIPYVRLTGPLLAGSEGVPWKQFTLINVAALLLYTPLSIAIGYYFHGALGFIIMRLTALHHLLFVGGIIVFGLGIGWYIGNKLGLEKKIIAIMPLRAYLWIPLLVVVLVLGGYSLWTKSGTNQIPGGVDTGTLYEDPLGRFSLLVPSGFSVREKSMVYGDVPVVILGRGNNTIPDEIALRILPIPLGKSYEDVLLKDVLYDGSGMSPKSLSEFTEKKIGENTFYYIRSGLFEGQLRVGYYLPRGKEVYVFTLLEDNLTDWTAPAFDVFNTSAHVALQATLQSFVLK